MRTNEDGKQYRALVDRLVLLGASGVFLIGIGALSKLYDGYSKILDKHEEAIATISRSLQDLHLTITRNETRLEGVADSVGRIASEQSRGTGLFAEISDKLKAIEKKVK